MTSSSVVLYIYGERLIHFLSKTADLKLSKTRPIHLIWPPIDHDVNSAFDCVEKFVF